MATKASRALCASVAEASLFRFTRPRTSGIRLSPSIHPRAFSSSRIVAADASPAYVRKPTIGGNTSPSIEEQLPISDLTTGLSDEPIILDEGARQVDWTRSFHGLSAEPFAQSAADILLAPVQADDVEVKPDGIIYLPEIKYRRILNKAFGPGGWGLAPRGETIVTGKSVTREYALVAHGRLGFTRIS